MECPICEATLVKGSKFCSECGTELKKAASADADIETELVKAAEQIESAKTAEEAKEASKSILARMVDFFKGGGKPPTKDDEDKDKDEDEDEGYEDEDEDEEAKSLTALFDAGGVDEEVRDAEPILKAMVQRDEDLRRELRKAHRQLEAIEAKLAAEQEKREETNVMVKAVCDYVEGVRMKASSTQRGRASASSADILTKSLTETEDISGNGGVTTRFGLTDEQLIKGLVDHVDSGKGDRTGINVHTIANMHKTPADNRPKAWYEAAAAELGVALKDE